MNTDSQRGVNLFNDVIQCHGIGCIDDRGAAASIGDAELSALNACSTIQGRQRRQTGCFAATLFERDCACADRRCGGVRKSLADALLGRDQPRHLQLIGSNRGTNGGACRQDIGIAAGCVGIEKSLGKRQGFGDRLDIGEICSQARIRSLLVLGGSDLGLHEIHRTGIQGNQRIDEVGCIQAANQSYAGGNLSHGCLIV